MDGYKQSDVIKDCKFFLRKIEELKSYIIKFDKVGVMKPKVYSPDCVMKEDNQPFVILITYDKYIFLANNEVYKA